jgi:hypothetical protein
LHQRSVKRASISACFPVHDTRLRTADTRTNMKATQQAIAATLCAPLILAFGGAPPSPQTALARAAQSSASNQWIALPPIKTARQEVAAAALNGKIYVFGGYDANRMTIASAEVYDPAART